MAGSVPLAEALHSALSREQRQKMEHRSSKEILLDEETIALRDLSHQRSPVSAPPAPTKLQTEFQSGTNVGQTGWRRNSRDDLTDGNGVHALTMGRIYQKMGKLSIIPRYLVYILPLALIIAVPLIIGAVIPKLELGVRTPKRFLISREFD